MKYEVVEAAGEWIVRCEEAEVARFEGQAAALQEVARRLRDSEPQAAAQLALRFQSREAGRRPQTRISK